MKKLLIIIFTVSILLSVNLAAVANPIALTDTTSFNAIGTDEESDLVAYGGSKVNLFEGIGDFVTWNHQFSFIPQAAEILSGSLTIFFTDDERDTLNPFSWELAIGYAEDGSWDIGAIDTRSYSYNIDVDYLYDGNLQVNVVSLLGDFYINKSVLDITYDTAPVPEPATMILLGSGLVGMAGFGRKRFFKKD